MYENSVTEADAGREFYYALEAINAAGERSVSSGLAMGFSLMPGAPPKPDSQLPADSGRGNSAAITISWGPVAAADYYVVFRYSSSDSSLLRVAANVTSLSWTDPGPLEPYTYYYYQIQAVNEEDGKTLKSSLSPAVEAFILSPPQTAEALKSGAGDISIQWYPALGAPADQALYSYLIEGADSLYGPFSLVHTVSAPAAVNAEGYILVDSAPSRPFYRIKTKNGSVESAAGPVFAPAPKAAVILDASQAAYFSGKIPNANGVYPVQITWQKPDGDDPVSYHVYRSTTPDSPGRPITPSPIPASAESGGQFTWYDENSAARARTRYYYRVLSLNALDQGKNYSDTKIGYGILTPVQFFLEYNKTVKKSHTKLTLMHKPSTGALGTESATGISGRVDYQASLDGLGAAITMHYQNYADFYVEDNIASSGFYFLLNGYSNTSANMSSNGSMNGTMNITGMYKGTVVYDGIEIKGGAAGGGSYSVRPEGFPSAAAVSWTEGEK
jgi:hypothetical protein